VSFIALQRTAVVGLCAGLVACASGKPETRLLTREELLACELSRADLLTEQARLGLRQRNLGTLQAKLQDANRQLWTQASLQPTAASGASREVRETVATLKAAIDESNADGTALYAESRAHSQRIAAYNASCTGVRYWSSDADWVERRLKERRAARAAAAAASAAGEVGDERPR